MTPTWKPSKRALLATLAALPAAGLFASAARAEIEVNVNRGDVQPLPIAIPAFGGGPTGADISGVIAANLQRSGLFRPLDPASFVEKDLNAAVQPNFPAWKQINAQALVNGQVDPGSASAGASENSSNPVVKAAAERAIRSVYTVAALKLITPDFYGQRVSANFTGNEACPS